MMEKTNKNQTQSSKIFTLLIFSLFVVLGGVIGYMIAGAPDTILKEYRKPVPNIIMFLITYLLTVFIHELTHLVAFKIQGIPIRAFFVSAFVFLKHGNKMSLKFNYNKVLRSGGMVVPIIPHVKNEWDLTQVQKQYSRAILAAPVFSALFGVVCIALTVIVFPYLNTNTKAYFAAFAVWMVIFSLEVNLLSFIKTPIVFGDYPAAKAYKKDRLFACSSMYSYLLFMENSLECREKAKYLKACIHEEIEKKIRSSDDHDFITVGAVDLLLVESLVGFDVESDTVRKIGNHYADNPDLLTNAKATEPHRILFVHILFWLKSKEDARLNSLLPLVNNLFKNKEMQKYYDTQLSQIVKGENHIEYLTNKKNIKNTSAYTLYRLFDGYYVDELKLNHIVNIGCLQFQ